jgi:ubiquinone biosynthesis protein
MFCSFTADGYLKQAALTGLHTGLFAKGKTRRRQTAVLQAALSGPFGETLRNEIGKSIVNSLQVESLVPEVYAQWRPLVRDAMFFMATHLSAPRLAPKVIEQIHLPAKTPPEARLLRLISKVPGLQKLGQVLARNRHLHLALRRELSRLENGISDVKATDVLSIIRKELGPHLEACKVKIEPSIFSEASVSAVVRFSWWNPELRARERGVFKVMKPHVSGCFAEDMHLLAELAKFLGSKHREYGFAAKGIPDTFQEVRLLLEHEVHFATEQKSLIEAGKLYGSVRGVRVPRLIPSLCTSKITALTEEKGQKITDAVASLPVWKRKQVAEQLIETLIAVPLFSPEGEIVFHADPHAGNLLYSPSKGELVLLDWALTEHLSREQRRHLTTLFLMLALRDPAGVFDQIQCLQRQPARYRQDARLIRGCITSFFDRLPFGRLPGVVDALHLVEQLAYRGVRFPAPLIMLRKILFTLDGVLHDVSGGEVDIELVLTRYAARNWNENPARFRLPFIARDWWRLQSSALFYSSRVWLQGAQRAASAMPSSRP